MHSKRCNNKNKNKNLNSIELLELECLEHGGLIGCLLTLREADTFRKTRDIFNSSERYVLHGSCNSLILISLGFYDGGGMRICNPSIRKSLLLPHCPLFQQNDYNNTYVLGFESQSNDFKVIAISFLSIRGVPLPEMRLAVFTLNDQQWIVRDRDDGLSPNHLYGPYYFFDGGAHWLGWAPCNDSISNQDNKPTHLISLDFDTESFTFVELALALDEDIITLRFLFLHGESLAYFCISCERLKVWVLKQESRKREWTLWFSGPSALGFDVFYYEGSRTKRVLYCDGDGDGDSGYLIYAKISYNIATGQVEPLQKTMNPYRTLEPYGESLVFYYESLVLCKGYGVEDTTTSPIRWGK
ncbi:uncharacterized protein LOC141587656 [Silene latifolia]|uniref:uncharacterized protein LOC141587656 n=1 Tax=Silene latifolia TaxID=37657 RepID=UPI003D76B9FB